MKGHSSLAVKILSYAKWVSGKDVDLLEEQVITGFFFNFFFEIA